MKEFIAAITVLSCLTLLHGFEPTPERDFPQAVAGEVVRGDTCRVIDTYLTQLAKERNFSGGLLIVRKGEKIMSKGYGWADQAAQIPFTSRTLASMGSITKAFTATAIMKLVEQGKLSVEDRLDKFFPTVPQDKAGITIHQLLTHSSGFHEFLEVDGGDYERIETEAFLQRAFAEPLAFVPGSKAVYTNVGMSVLGIVIEQVSGLEYEAYLRQHILAPLGIHQIGYHAQLDGDAVAHGYENGKDWGSIQKRLQEAGGRPYWNLKANGGLEASLDDMYLWANAFTNHKVLSQSSIDKMFTAHILEDGYEGRSSFGYGCNLFKSRRQTNIVDNGGSNGIYFARMMRDLDAGVVIYLVTNEATLNANMVMPNIAQLYFYGKIEQDGTAPENAFGNPVAAQIYKLLLDNPEIDLGKEIATRGIQVDDDMMLFEIGQRLAQEQRPVAAKSLYLYYTQAFPNIVVGWNELGEIYVAEGNKAEAKHCFEQALKLRPGNPRATENLKQLGN